MVNSCPICDGTLRALDNTNFALCPKDALIVNLKHKPFEYEKNYFDNGFETQYGKSYLNDKETILAKARFRIKKAERYFTAKTHPYVLEVGSAAGFFLEELRTKGFRTEGWEISKTMANYANAQRIHTVRQDFFVGAKMHKNKNAKPYDVLALFFVLEHFAEQRKAWESLSHLIRKGGYLLLSIPSYQGPTFRFARKKWYKTHPEDHAVDYSPKAIKCVGARFGFSLCAVFSEGIHPQRFPLGNFFPLSCMYRKLIENFPISDTLFAILERTH
ncbi:MAG: hypothetical protein LDLANPLL_02466 [Turneriella sp.]|nr:hypothetical protein [Turneriella sp.]